MAPFSIGPRWEGSDFPSLSVPFLYSAPVPTLQFGARRLLCPKSGPSRTPSPPFRPPPRNAGRREGPRLAPLTLLGSGLPDRPGPLPRRCPWAKCGKQRRFLQDLPAFLCSVFSSQGPFQLGINFFVFKCFLNRMCAGTATNFGNSPRFSCT